MVAAHTSSHPSASAGWIICLDKRPTERSREDVDVILARLQNLKAFERFHPSVLQQICMRGFYEYLERGITLYRQGDIGTSWYAVLSGSLDVKVSETANHQDAVTICTLGAGTAFGESVLDDRPRPATIVTRETSELLRLGQTDFRCLWGNYHQYMAGLLPPPYGVMENSRSNDQTPDKENISNNTAGPLAKHLNKKPLIQSPAKAQFPISVSQKVPSENVLRAGKVLHKAILARAPHMIRDRKFHLKTYRRCCVGIELVDWQMQQSCVHSRSQAVGMWQALLEEGVLNLSEAHWEVDQELSFQDKYVFYRFLGDEQDAPAPPGDGDPKEGPDELQEALGLLAQLGPDAHLRMVLRKRPSERTADDLEIIYEELLHIKALSHLSITVKRELSGVLIFESHANAGTVLFSQGEEGTSWYIILKGSVNVVIYGKGVVCTLHEGDDFGKLALVNDSPRAASIVLHEDNCHFLRVNKEDFNRILRGVEANTVRLKEHHQDVLVLEKSLSRTPPHGTPPAHHKYTIMAGTPEKILEHLLEMMRLDAQFTESDPSLDDFVLMHCVFIPNARLCPASQGSEQEQLDYTLNNKRRVVRLVLRWATVHGHHLQEEDASLAFLQEFLRCVTADARVLPLKDQLPDLQKIVNSNTEDAKASKKKHKILLRQFSMGDEKLQKRQPIKGTDEILFKVYCCDHTYTTIRVAVGASAREVVEAVADKLGSAPQDLLLVSLSSAGDKVLQSPGDVSVFSALPVNGRLFACTRDQLDSLVPLPEQEGPSAGSLATFELMSSKDVAYQLSVYDWELFHCVHEHELIYHTFGKHRFKKTTANLDLFLRRFNETQLWVVTEVCLCTPLNKRVQLFKKFIKIAAHCKEYGNLNSFFAVIMGMSNPAVCRLSLTWEKLPSKFKKFYGEFENLMDPSRNHRAYRLTVGQLRPPVIPFMPLLIKGPDSAQSARNHPEVRSYVRQLHVIDNQRTLSRLSLGLEPRRA
ncbi:unnamed protein product [Gadus morhua 'NCC']